MTYEAIVLRWLQTKRPEAASVVKVSNSGTDWNGDTAGGFYSEFEVIITYVDDREKQQHYDVEGEDMAELWGAVVGALPKEAS